MKVLAFSDLHAHAWGQFATMLPNGRNSRLQHTLDVLEQIHRYCIEEHVTHVFMLGDVFHSRTNVNVDVFSATWEAFRAISEVVDHFVIVRGNHDSYDQNGKQHSLKAFEEFATVVSTQRIMDLDGLRVAAIGYTSDMEEWKTFAKFVTSDLDFFLFHQGVTDGEVGAFNIALKAEVKPEDVPTHKAGWCLAGHYHKHQWMRPNLGFVGSPLQHSFNERTEVKGFLTFAREGDKWGEPQQVLSTAPRFYLFSSYDEFLTSGVNPNEHYVRVIETSDVVAKIVREHPAVQVEIRKEEVAVQARVDEETVQDDRLLLATYCESRGMGGDEELLEIGLSLLLGDSE